MRKIAFYDVETTGLNTSVDEVIQFAAIITDENLNPISVINRFTFSNREIHPKAFEVHGINRADLLKLSAGIYFEEIVREYDLFHNEPDVLWVAYNDKFDKSIMNNTLSNNSYDKPISFGSRTSSFHVPDKGRFNMDAMTLFNNGLNYGQHGKLAGHVAKFNQEKTNLSELYNKFCSKLKMTFPIKGSHDALFDCFAMWVICSTHKSKVFL